MQLLRLEGLQVLGDNWIYKVHHMKMNVWEKTTLRYRGITRMGKVHTRPFDKRVVIDMNDKFQPVSDDDRVVSEFVNFPGIMAKRCVPLTYVSWRHVLDTLNDTMWNHLKSYGPSWLVGRYVNPSKIATTNAPTETYVQDLTNKIRQSEANPNITVDLGELCATISSDTENVTPATGGTSS
ncbi:hypothetical protein POM88_053230 [Heracleum sosnowskyi]|uniref:Uncharacterized protein n=1 Tax=Heracleum sosnowskyi TaxID=360622 RepID=A0AAD8LXZ2_9APIA|nr:hypothetical protein POM88_053230 [Heracleum sosnowskyi]